ncbi:MAG: PKD domain-containing protein [Candidatus Latescibacterota bacterium]
MQVAPTSPATFVQAFLTLACACCLLATPLVAQIPSLEDLPLQASVGQYGITWTFADSVRIGRFVTGDYYIVGPAVVTDVSPVFDGVHHGSMHNPAYGSAHGYDGRIPGFDAQLVARPPLELHPGDVLVSVVSHLDDGTHPDVFADFLPHDASLSHLESAAVLTCLAEPAPADAFRPPYCRPHGSLPDGSSTASLFRAGALHRELLPALPAPPSTPPVERFVRLFERPWLDHHAEVWNARLMHPTENMPDYGAYMSRAVSEASLLLVLDLPAEAKDRLLLPMVQLGVDVWGVARDAGPSRGWEAMGGHGSGRKWPMLLAGWLFQDAEILGTRAVFGEDQQTYYGQGWNGATVLFRFFHREYPQSTWLYEELPPRQWESTVPELYRRTSTSMSWVGTALSARLLGAQEAWNHPAFFDYADRWMEADDDADREEMVRQLGPRYDFDDFDYFTQKDGPGTTWSPFVRDMWSLYRHAGEPAPLPPVPPVSAIGVRARGAAPGLRVLLDGQLSYDPDGFLVEHFWDFGDDTGARGDTVSHLYETPGEYRVRLTVTDNSGQTDTDTVHVTVGDTARYAVHVDSSLVGYHAIYLNDGIIDPDGGRQGTWASAESLVEPHWVVLRTEERRLVDSVRVWWARHPLSDLWMVSRQVDVQYWDGEGYRTVARLAADGGEMASSWATFPPVLTDRLRLRQPPGQGPEAYPGLLWLAEIDYRAEVPNQPPAAQLTPTYCTGVAPLCVVFGADASGDADGEIVAYAWDFGDGTTDAGLGATHTFADRGTYTVTLTVTDDDGATAQATAQVEVPARVVRVAASSADSGYGAAAVVADGVRGALGGPATTWRSAENGGTAPWVVLYLEQPVALEQVTAWWGFDPDRQTWATSRRVLVQAWNGAGWETVGALGRAGSDVDRSTATFAPVTTQRVRLRQPPDKGNPASPALLWLAEVELGPGSAPLARAVSQTRPAGLRLEANAPNPFNAATTLAFEVAEALPARLAVYDLLGQQVAVLFDGVAQPGQRYARAFDAAGLATGLYFARLQSGPQVQVRKMLLAR